MKLSCIPHLASHRSPLNRHTGTHHPIPQRHASPQRNSKHTQHPNKHNTQTHEKAQTPNTQTHANQTHTTPKHTQHPDTHNTQTHVTHMCAHTACDRNCRPGAEAGVDSSLRRPYPAQGSTADSITQKPKKNTRNTHGAHGNKCLTPKKNCLGNVQKKTTGISSV